jgi:Icc-related predicted phosphoesterase
LVSAAACGAPQAAPSSADGDGVYEPEQGAGVVADLGADEFAGDGWTATDAVGRDSGASDPDSSTPANLRIVVISDLNESYGSATYSSHVHQAIATIKAKISPDLVLMTGDLVAGQQAGLNYSAMWAGFHAAVTDPLTAAGVVVAPTPGNHDASGYAAYAKERQIFVDEWTKANRVPALSFVDGSGYPLRYSFAYRGAFFISLDATTVGKLSQEQRDWVAMQLKGAAHYPIKIALVHVPLHPAAASTVTEVLGDSKLEQIFAESKLTVFISGHHHAYYPGASGGVRQIAMACLGAGPRALIGSSTVSPRSFVVIDVQHDAITSLEAYGGAAFDTVIARSTLPPSVSSGAHQLVRDDLAGF